MLQVTLPLLDAHIGLADLLVAQLNLQRLELNLLRQRVVLAVVLHIVELFGVAVDARLGLLDVSLLHADSLAEFVYLTLDFLHTGGQTHNFVFQVLNFERQLTAQCFFLIDGRQCRLQLIEGFQALLHRQVSRIFFCHNLSFNTLSNMIIFPRKSLLLFHSSLLFPLSSFLSPLSQ